MLIFFNRNGINLLTFLSSSSISTSKGRLIPISRHEVISLTYSSPLRVNVSVSGFLVQVTTSPAFS